MMNDSMTEPHCLIEVCYGPSRFQDVFAEPRKWLRQTCQMVSWRQADETGSRNRDQRSGPWGSVPRLSLKGVTVLLLHLRDVLVVAEHLVQEPPLNRPSGGSFTALGPDELSSVHQRQPHHDVPGRAWGARG